MKLKDLKSKFSVPRLARVDVTCSADKRSYGSVPACRRRPDSDN